LGNDDTRICLINNRIASGYAEILLKYTLVMAYIAYTGKWYDHACYVKALRELPINTEKQARNLHIFIGKESNMNFNI
jgi:hypothetical protein